MAFSILRVFVVASMILVLAAMLPAQILSPSSLIFSTRSTAFADSAGASAGNQTGRFGDDSIILHSPNPLAPSFAYECADYATFAAHFGDEDGDGSYTDTIIGNLDAVYAPPGIPNPPNLFDLYFSISVDTGILGKVGPDPIDEADIVRLLPRGGHVKFISKAQIQTAVGTTLASSFDINGFTVDETNGDLYWTTTATYSLHTSQSVTDGAIVRLPGTAYTANPDGTVASVSPNSAELLLDEAETSALFINAGYGAVTDLTAIEIAETIGTYTSTSTGLVMPHLWLSRESTANGPVIVTTESGGTTMSLNFISFNAPGSLGLDAATSSNTSVSALGYMPGFLATSPRMCDTFPLGLTTGPGTSFDIDVGGATPNSQVIVGARIGEGMMPGGYTHRWDIFNPLEPIHTYINGGGGFYEFYLQDATDPVFQWSILNGPINTDSEGYARLTVATPASLPAGIAIVWQYLDLGNLSLSTPVVVVTQ